MPRRRMLGRIVVIQCLLLACVFSAAAVWAEDVTISASVRQRSIAVGGEINLSVVVTGSGLSSLPDPVLPKIELAAVFPAGRSSSSSFSLVNGRVSHTNSVTHNYVVVPEKEGDLVIGPISVTHKGQTRTTAPITVQVVAGSGSYTAPSVRSRAESAPPAEGARDLFVELTADRKRAFVTEQIILTLRFYTRVNLLGQPEYVPPTMTGFWVEPLPKQPSYETVVDGTTYLVLEVKSAVFPTRSGTLTIEPATLRCAVQQPAPNAGRDPFDRFRRGFFGMMDRGRDVTLTTDPVEIEVLPLPNVDVPASFGGAVGRYTMSVKADKSTVKQGDPVTVTITISGRGNINTISTPSIPQIPGMRSYDSGSRVDAAGTAEGLEGQKIYERVVIPEVSGEFSIGPIEFSYFDPQKEAYRTLSADPIQVSVAPGPVVIGPEPELPDKQEVRLLGRDVRHIHTGGGTLRRRSDPLYESPWFLLAQILPLAAYLGTVGYRRHAERLSEDVGYARMRRADRMARRRLAAARKHLDDPDGLAFSSALERATREFVGDKYNLAAGGMTYDQMEKNLQSRGIPYSLISDLSDCLQAAEQARFCPADLGLEERRAMLRNTEEVISRLGKHKT